MILGIELGPRIIPDMGCGIKPIYRIYTNSIIVNIETNKLVGQYDNGKGYLQCVLLTNTPGKPTTKKIHRLMLYTFNYIPGCEKLQVNHIDCNKYNNNLYNLEWCTNEENAKHAMDHSISRFHDGLAKVRREPTVPDYQAIIIGNMLLSDCPINMILSTVPNTTREIINSLVKGRICTHLFTEEQFETMRYNYLGKPLTDNERHGICKFYEIHRKEYGAMGKGGTKKLILDALYSIGRGEEYFNVAESLLYRLKSPEITSLYTY